MDSLRAKYRRITESQIISEVPELFAHFWKHQQVLLWRGSRDGFGASDYHNRCDGHRNILTLVLDTDGNIFGGFTPAFCETRPITVHPYKYDPSGKCFLFTLKNPHNIAPRRFALSASRCRLNCLATCGPNLDLDFEISDHCNTNSDSSTRCFGYAFRNDTWLYGCTVFTDTTRFRVKEIEVFEIQNDCAEILLNEEILNDELFDEEEIATLISQANITRDRAIEALRNASREPDPSKMFFPL
jgi:hypothetical protein